MIEETRLRKICPQCTFLYIKKSKKNNCMYLCTKCHALFKVPAMKECKTVSGVPSGFVKIIEKKRAKHESALNE